MNFLGLCNENQTYIRRYALRLSRLLMACMYMALCGNHIKLTQPHRFLLARLHLESLRTKFSPKAVRDALNKLPSGLDDAYTDAMQRIEATPDQAELAKRILLWITCAKRPLTVLALQHALATEVNKREFDEQNIMEPENIVSICAGLVIINEQSDIIRLVHYTTQKYFETRQKIWFPDAEVDITATCMTYLSFDVFSSGRCHTDSSFEKRLSLNLLYDYTACYWGQHADQASKLHEKAFEFLNYMNNIEAAVQAMLVHKNYASSINYSQIFPRRITGLHLAAYFSISEPVVRILEDDKIDVDSKDSYVRTPLSLAAVRGLLLATGKVDVNSKNRYRYTPLALAAARGHEAVIKLLQSTTTTLN